MTALKAFVALIVSFAGAMIVALGTGNNSTIGSIDAKHWMLIALTTLGSGGMVWFTENGPDHTYIKAVVAFLTGGIAALVTALNDGVISQSEMIVAFVAAVTATGLVYQVKNKTKQVAGAP